MKKTAAFLMVFTFLACFVAAQEQQQEMTEEQKAWMEYMSPGETHKLFEQYVGEWNVKSTFWMQPGAEPMISEGKASYEFMFGGRYLKMAQTGTSMGMPYEGTGIMGYDNGKKEYFSTWIDNMGTGIGYSTGNYNEATKSIEMGGSMWDPTQKKTVGYRIVFSFVDGNSHKMEFYSPAPDGKEFKSFEMVYTK